jgi:hypothetical protein
MNLSMQRLGHNLHFKKNVAKIGTIQLIVMVVIYVNNLIIFESFLAIL